MSLVHRIPCLLLLWPTLIIRRPITWSGMLEDVAFTSLATSLTNFPLRLLCAFTPSACTEGQSGTGTVLQQMSEALRCSQAPSPGSSDPQASTSSLPRSSVLIITADERSFASISTPVPLRGTFVYPTQPARSLSSKLQQVQTFSVFGPPKYV